MGRNKKIKIQELRIGNYIHHNGGLMVVNGIERSVKNRDHVFYHSDYMSGVCDLEDVAI